MERVDELCKQAAQFCRGIMSIDNIYGYAERAFGRCIELESPPGSKCREEMVRYVEMANAFTRMTTQEREKELSSSLLYSFVIEAHTPSDTL